jgi:hypothetical protein
LIAQAFRTTTPRLIGIELDLVELKVRYWIDGKPLPDMTKDLPPGKQWVPTVAILDTGLEVVLNPFCIRSDPALSRD